MLELALKKHAPAGAGPEEAAAMLRRLVQPVKRKLWGLSVLTEATGKLELEGTSGDHQI